MNVYDRYFNQIVKILKKYPEYERSRVAFQVQCLLEYNELETGRRMSILQQFCLQKPKRFI